MKSKTNVRAEVGGVALSHADKVLYKEQGITKLDLAGYYEKVAKHMLTQLAGRPLVLVRCPAGKDGECFFQKHPGLSFRGSKMKFIKIKEGSNSGEYVLASSAQDLIKLAQYNTLEIHQWGSTAAKLENPERMVFDLDPGPGVTPQQIMETAKMFRDFLAKLKLASFVKTTGGKGLHVVVPLNQTNTWDEVKEFSHQVSLTFQSANPDLFVSKMTKSLRKGKIFVDYLRNGRGSTAISNYSTRARPGAPVAVPLDWSELKKGFRFDKFDIYTVPGRLARGFKDPWRDFAKKARALPRTSLGKS